MNAVNNTNTHLDADTLDRLKKAIRLRKSNRIMQHHVAAEMGYASKSTVGNIERLENNYGLETVERYIRAVHKLVRVKRSGKPCASPQIAITIPAPVEPPAATPAAPRTPGRSVLELLAIINQCNEELARHRAAWAAMMGRDDDAEWNNQLATFSTPRTP
jgi:transcriptional regulator with XRE-family HTH domain